MPYRQTIAELEARRKELEAQTAELEARIDELKLKQMGSGIVDDTRILNGADKKTPPPAVASEGVKISTVVD